MSDDKDAYEAAAKQVMKTQLSQLNKLLAHSEAAFAAATERADALTKIVSGIPDVGLENTALTYGNASLQAARDEAQTARDERDRYLNAIASLQTPVPLIAPAE